MACYENVRDLLQSMRDHVKFGGEAIQLDDVPMKLLLGFRSKDTSWHIKISDLRRSRELVGEEIWRSFATVAGRQGLIAKVATDEPFE